MRKLTWGAGVAAVLLVLAIPAIDRDLVACAAELVEGALPIAPERAQRFLGKVAPNSARCRGGERAVLGRESPWLDWGNYWGTGDATRRRPDGLLSRGERGVLGALADLEYQRIELLELNLFDNQTFADYLRGRDRAIGPNLAKWPALRLPPTHPGYARAGGDGPQRCRGESIRFRNVDGTCNDIDNPMMGAAGQPFGRNADFRESYPDLADDLLVRNRHGSRLAQSPDPQVVSRLLLSRRQSQPERCAEGRGQPGRADGGHCDYQPASSMNVLAAYWIQFMTHDWFSHLDHRFRNSPELMDTGCRTRRVDGVERELTPQQAAEIGCRPADRMERALFAETSAPPTIEWRGEPMPLRSRKTTANNVTAWWDASQLYGYDTNSRLRVKRDPSDRARFLFVARGAGEARDEYLPPFQATDPTPPEWHGQEAAAFGDNWTVGLSFLHNLFMREHNSFVAHFRRKMAELPGEDSGLRRPDAPATPVRYGDVSDDELFEIARLVVAAGIAKIHTIEWTTQLLYNDVLYRAMNANWHGLLKREWLEMLPGVAEALAKALRRAGHDPRDPTANARYSLLSSGPGIIGLGSDKPHWKLSSLDDVNGGVHHFGVPFSFPEEFVSVYRLHPLVPDMLELRALRDDPNRIVRRVAVIDTFRGRATGAMREHGMNDWALTLGRQRLGRLTLNNHPLFQQNLFMPDRLAGIGDGRLDNVALDLARDRERGITRYNEFRRQYGLRALRGFDDFGAAAAQLRSLYGTHVCDASRIVSRSQLDPEGTRASDGRHYPNDCLGRPDGSTVDNIEDLDLVVGMLAENVRPHGFAISETQFQVFILNASRRLFSDRFFTSSFRPEFYSSAGIDWVHNNGPGGLQYEEHRDNGRRVEVSPLKRVLLRNIPELAAELASVRNAFDPWARSRGEYYSLEWKPRPGAESDPAFNGGKKP